MPAASTLLDRWATGAVVGGLVAVHALEGGMYDVVERSQAAVLVWWLLFLGLATRLLPRTTIPRAAAWPLAGFAALAGLTLASLAWTESDERTTIELARVGHHAGVFLLVLCLVTRSTWRAAAAGVLAAAVGVCGVAMASRLLPETFPLDLVAREFRTTRLSLPLNYWNAVAAWGAMSTALVLGWATSGPGGPRRGLILGAAPLTVATTYLAYSRAGAAGLLLAAAFLAVATKSRLAFAANVLTAAAGAGAVIVAIRSQTQIARATGDDGALTVAAVLAAAMAACGAMGYLTARSRLPDARLPRRATGAALAAAAVVAAGAAVTLGPAIAEQGWESFRHRAEPAAADPAARLSLSGNRYNIWASALAAARAQPVRGIGAGSFEYWWNREARDPEYVRDAHSLYLETLAELGGAGLLALSLLLAGLGLALLGATRGDARGVGVPLAAAFGVYLLHAGVDWMWELTGITVLALALAAVAARSRPDPPGLRRASGGAIRAASLAAAAAALVVQLPVLVGMSSVRKSEDAFRAGDADRADAAASDAVAALPWGSTPYVQRALVAEARGDLRSARAALEAAAAREPTNWRPPLLLSRVLAAQGDVDAALRAHRLARRLRPFLDVSPES